MSAEQIENWSQMEVIYNLKMKSPGSIPVLCSDKSLEDSDNEILPNEMPKRVIVDAAYMRERDQENESSPQKEDYDEYVIDKKAFVSGAKDFKQTCCTLNLPCRQKDCWRHTTVHYCTGYEDELHRQLTNLNEQKEIEPFNYSFNKQMYSGCQNIKPNKVPESQGGFGEVYFCQDIQTGWILAMKKGKKHKNSNHQNLRNKHLQVNEIKVPIQFPNEKNIARVLGCFFDGLDFYILQEHAGISLFDADKEELQFFRLANNSLIFAFQLFTGLNVLSQHGITHCDVKPQNVCFNKRPDNSFLVKLIDFGSCQTQNDPDSLSGLTLEYLPPDLNKAYYIRLSNDEGRKESAKPLPLRRLNEKDDIYAAGLTVLYIYKQDHPMRQYFKEPLSKVKEEIRKENFRLIGDLTDPLDDYFTTGCTALDYILRFILVVNSDLRWTASPILNYLQDQLSRTKMSEPCDDFIDIKKGKGQHEHIISDIGNIPVEDGAQYLGLIMKSNQKYNADQTSDRARTTRQNQPGVGKYFHCAVQETNQQEAMEYSLQREQFVFPQNQLPYSPQLQPQYQPHYQSKRQPSYQFYHQASSPAQHTTAPVYRLKETFPRLTSAVSSSPGKECLPVTEAVKTNNIPRFDLLLGDSNLC